jgi:molybdopterin synthase catalytic subunit/adenylyltransferase/sulfurtransferase
MFHAKIINLKKEKIEFKKAEDFIASSKFGASLIFTGTVREINENKKVTGITYDSHDQMVIKSFKEIYNEIKEKLKLESKAVFIEHVKGYVGLGKISIIIAVACPHKTEAYIISRYIIEEIKKRSPIWKKEHYKNKESEWLKGNSIKIKNENY